MRATKARKRPAADPASNSVPELLPGQEYQVPPGGWASPDVAERILAAFAYAPRTEALVQWDGLAAWLKDAPLGLTDAERVELILLAANRGRLTGAHWSALVGAPTHRGLETRSVLLPEDVHRQVLRRLTDFVSAKDRARRDGLARAAAEAVHGHVVLVPEWRPRRGRADRIIASGPPAALVYALWVLMDPERPFRDRLCRCDYTECLQFFLSPPRDRAGAPRRSFCCAEHGRLGDREKSRERQALRRKKMANKGGHR